MSGLAGRGRKRSEEVGRGLVVGEWVSGFVGEVGRVGTGR